MKYIPPVNGDVGNPNRSYINPNLGIGQRGSIPPAEALEHPQREILEVITSAGIVPNDANLTQLKAAILWMITNNGIGDATDTVKGKVELATGAEALAGIDTTRAVTSAGLASGKSLANSGYYKHPGGFIVQWGRAIGAEGATATITLPISFPTNNFGVLATGDYSGRPITNYVVGQTSNPTLSGFDVRIAVNGDANAAGQTSAVNFFWIALGN